MSSCVREHSIICDRTCFVYLLRRKAVKNINLRIDTDGSIKVSAPQHVSIKQIEDFLRQKLDWIRSHQQKALKAIPASITDESIIQLWGAELRLILHEGSPRSSYANTVELHLYCKKLDNEEALFKSLEQYLTKEFTEKALAVVELYAEQMGTTLPSVKIRRMRSRWGSCRPTRNSISLNLNLVHASHECLHMIVAHELLHFSYYGHSKAFYNDLSLLIPHWQERRRELRYLHI